MADTLERIPHTDPRLGRHVWHDERSRRFPAPMRSAPLRSVRHHRHVPVFDQGDLGSCTGNAAIGCLATGLFYATINAGDAAWLRTLDQEAARAVYSAATRVDPFDGEWPPEDTGSTGLAVAKVLKDAGAISGYRHAFRAYDALTALMATPLIVGTNWWSEMYSPDEMGVARVAGQTVGGHEYLLDEYVAPAESHARFGRDGSAMVGFTNSWGSSWGLAGRFYLTVADFQRLLAAQGDATVFVPNTEPAPAPSEVP